MTPRAAVTVQTGTGNAVTGAGKININGIIIRPNVNRMRRAGNTGRVRRPDGIDFKELIINRLGIAGRVLRIVIEGMAAGQRLKRSCGSSRRSGTVPRIIGGSRTIRRQSNRRRRRIVPTDRKSVV